MLYRTKPRHLPNLFLATSHGAGLITVNHLRLLSGNRNGVRSPCKRLCLRVRRPRLHRPGLPHLNTCAGREDNRLCARCFYITCLAAETSAYRPSASTAQPRLLRSMPQAEERFRRDKEPEGVQQTKKKKKLVNARDVRVKTDLYVPEVITVGNLAKLLNVPLCTPPSRCPAPH